MADEIASAPRTAGLREFFLLALLLLLIRLGLGFVVVPDAVAIVGSLVVSLLLVGLPIVALFRAASFPWNWKRATIVLFGGAALHLVGVGLMQGPMQSDVGVVVASFSQLGLLTWCLGLGVMLALLIKDRNLILPVAIFLAGFDAFLVFSPVGPTHQIVERQPALFESIAMSVPQVRGETGAREHPGAQLVPMAFVGPADLIFVGGFFVVLYRFRMRVRQTARWLIPVLGAYLLTVVVFGRTQLGPISLGMLPAMLPIGLTIYFVNRKEFVLTPGEKAATIGIALLSLGMAVAGIAMALTMPQPDSSPEPATVPARPKPPESANSPAPAALD